MHILVCGGAGYIGSHMARWLALRDIRVTVLDNLSTGHRGFVLWGDFIEADLLDPASLDRAFTAHRFDAVMHFCARSLVGESVADPYGYYASNVAGTLNQYNQTIVEVAGHTDSVGTDAYIQALSERRANSVAGYLGSRGIMQQRMIVVGAGETRPVASNDTDSGRAQNRRVEITLVPVRS